MMHGPVSEPEKPPASTVWWSESNQVGDEEVAFQERFCDPDTGLALLRLTSQPCINENIYPEAPISTPDGKRFIFARTAPLGGYPTFWIADLETRKVRQVTDEPGASAPIVAPDGSAIYYSVGHTVYWLSPETFERRAVFVFPSEFGWIAGVRSIAHDGGRLLTAARCPSGLFGVAVVDLGSGRAWTVYEGRDVRNAHPQYCRNSDRLVMVQVNDGISLDDHGNIVRLIGDLGASLHVVGDDPGAAGAARLEVGSSALERVQGHQCWLGPESRVITTLHWRAQAGQAWRQDRIVTIAPGEAQPRVVGEGHGFTHIHTTPDGRFWVSDCNRTSRIYVGSVATGRCRLVCSSGATFGAAQYTHPHPFFIGNAPTIGWNSDVTGIPHIYCAHLPSGFLEALSD